MKGLKVFLGLSCVFFLVFGLLDLFWPAKVAEWKLGPSDAIDARYLGSTFLAFFVASVYAFRSPKKNVAIVNAIIVGFGLSGLVGLWTGIAGDDTWTAVLPVIVTCVVIAAGLVIFYPRGEKPV
jgi:peptidoglycan/LPS O-acetylase OafA/YrhL